MARGSGGVGLGGIIIVCGVLYYTGYGAKMLTEIQGFDRHCYASASSLSRAVAGPVCQGVSAVVGGITKAADAVGGVLHKLDDLVSPVKQWRVADLGKSVSGLASAPERLNQLIAAGPASLASSNPLTQAVDSFSIGQHYIRSGSASQALPWLTSSASQPGGFGVLSQISLADLYRNGGSGIPANGLQAKLYYQQAAISIETLSHSNTMEAQRLLQSLPAKPQDMQRQLLRAAESIR